MNKAVIIAEKNSQAKDLQKALITDKVYKESLCRALDVSTIVITHASGHLLSLVEPEVVNPKWKNWTAEVLVPDDKIYPLEISPAGKKLFSTIKKELQNASVCIIATDCDREGQLIGENLVRYIGFTGTIKRALFTAQDKTSLQTAFSNLHDNNEYCGVYWAGVARANGDQISNLSNTRAVSVHLKDPRQKGAIGIGRVKTATQAIICKRQLQIDNFTPEDFYTPYINVQNIKLAYIGTGDVSQFQTEKKGSFFNKDTANEFLENLSDSCLITKTVKKKNTSPPKLPDLPELQKSASKLWGWGADLTLSTLQSLYESPNYLTTYPRAECRNIPEIMIDDAPAILKTLKDIFNVDLNNLEIRKGKSGAYDTKTVEKSSHHAVIPNVNCDTAKIQYEKLNTDEKQLYTLVCQYWLRMHAPIYEFEQTIITANVDDTIYTSIDVGGSIFQTKGNIPLNLGWKSINLCKEPKTDTTENTLPSIENGTYPLQNKAYDTGITQPPALFTDGDLISAMQNAWKYANGTELQQRLKDSKGIGTPATRDSIISGLLKQNILVKKGKNIIPSPMGLQMYILLNKICPSLVSPAETAIMELYLDKIASLTDAEKAKELTFKFIDIVCKKTAKINSDIETAGATTTLPISGTPRKIVKPTKHRKKRQAFNLETGKVV